MIFWIKRTFLLKLTSDISAACSQNREAGFSNWFNKEDISKPVISFLLLFTKVLEGTVNRKLLKAQSSSISYICGAYLSVLCNAAGEARYKPSVLRGGIYLNEDKGREMIGLELDRLNIRLIFLVLFFFYFKFLVFFISGIGFSTLSSFLKTILYIKNGHHLSGLPFELPDISVRSGSHWLMEDKIITLESLGGEVTWWDGNRTS